MRRGDQARSHQDLAIHKVDEHPSVALGPQHADLVAEIFQAIPACRPSVRQAQSTCLTCVFLRMAADSRG